MGGCCRDRMWELLERFGEAAIVDVCKLLLTLLIFSVYSRVGEEDRMQGSGYWEFKGGKRLLKNCTWAEGNKKGPNILVLSQMGLGSKLDVNSGYWNWIDDKLPRHVSTMIHNQKVELDSIRKERNHLKKIVEDMGGIEDPYLKDMIADEMSELKDMNGNEISDLTKVSTLKGKMSNLELPDKIESSNLKKVSSLDDKVLKLELKVHQLISLLAVSWAIIVGFVAAKMM
ncbi:hypothetical protein KY290_001775 [Solanum tuberosum]|uniref:Uncharacterized protein n=1 Tax=Solanum tuberosum TaxID=4113 RepID=A0ABQ7WQC7_SOLTU|nr:hypothetical protein KY290_001775 [Solanum tuberosum]